jgi:hypothetical protein
MLHHAHASNGLKKPNTDKMGGLSEFSSVIVRHWDKGQWFKRPFLASVCVFWKKMNTCTRRRIRLREWLLRHLMSWWTWCKVKPRNWASCGLTSQHLHIKETFIIWFPVQSRVNLKSFCTLQDQFMTLHPIVWRKITFSLPWWWIL